MTKALVFRLPERIAKADIKCKLLKKSVIESVLNLVSSEFNGLCSTSKLSILRKCNRENIANFNLQSLFEEWKTRAPVFYSFLLTCSNCKLMKTCSFLPSGVSRISFIKATEFPDECDGKYNWGSN